jgi:two-component system, sensor histidine kinase and response regulator
LSIFADRCDSSVKLKKLFAAVSPSEIGHSLSPLPKFEPMFSGTFPPIIREQLQQLWQQMATAIVDDVVILTEETAKLSLEQGLPHSWQHFCLLLSPEFSVLAGLKPLGHHYQLTITFDAIEIRGFLATLSLSDRYPNWQGQINSHYWQSRFTTLLLQQLPRVPETLVDAPMQMALTQQIDREKLIYEVVGQIRQSLELPQILKNALDKVQSYLQLDRLIIYQFDERTGEAADIQQRLGQVAYESRLDDSIPSVLHFREPRACFDDFQHWQDYLQGKSKAISNVRDFYAEHPCFSEQMELLQVRSKLVVPIILMGQLWGLLIAHDCHQCYEWQDWQQQLLKRVAEHLEIAIYQAVIYSQLENQKNILEQQVNRQTRDLRDALAVAQLANEAKTEFLAVLSHELRTPLTSILGMSYTLLNLLNTNLDDRQKSYLQTIKHSGDHLLELIDDMLEVSKLEAGKAVLKVSEFSLMKMLAQVMQMVQPQADRQQVNLRMEIMDGEDDISQDPSQDVRFRGDIKRIKQISINLLTNAIKFTEASGEIVFRAWREFDYLVLQIEDTGIGIPQSQIPLIFHKFRQLDSTLDREYSGMGLGLALTKQLVELHGGWIEVESEEGSGSTFTVWLAAQALRLPKAAAVPTAVLIERSSIKTIVLVETEDPSSGFIADILTAAGYQVVSLTETSLAHKQIQLWQPDLVIIDQQIGEAATNQILRYLHNLTDSQHIRYLLISSGDRQDSQEKIVEVDRLLWNPIHPEKLLDKITKLL